MNNAKQTAQAYFLIYRSLPDEVRDELKGMIASDYSELQPDELYKMSQHSLADIWNAPENDHWDKFFKTVKQ